MTGQAVEAVRDVGQAISDVSNLAGSIAAAVEQQTAATREIAQSVQTVTDTTSEGAAAMSNVLSIASRTDASSAVTLRCAAEIRATAETLQSEVLDFLGAVSSGNEAERRRYERVPVENTWVDMRVAGGSVISVPVIDLSRGGMSIRHGGDYTPGCDLEIGLPGGGMVRGRIARIADDRVGILFRQDRATLAKVDQSLDLVCGQSLQIAS
jgi:methyl-accepting chemotaxis protein